MSYDKEKFLEEIANEPMTFMGGDIPSIDDIANRIHIAWYKGLELKLSEEVKAYTESLRTPADGDEPLPKSSVENEIEESWNLAEYIYMEHLWLKSLIKYVHMTGLYYVI